MKKSFIGIAALAVCSIFIFMGCAPAAPATQPEPSPSPSGDGLVLAAKGEITDIAANDGGTSITVDGSNTESGATYQLLIANMTDKVPVVSDGEQENYADGSLNVGDTVEIYLNETTPVTASEPPMATPEKVVVTARGDGASGGAVNTPDLHKDFGGTIIEISPDGEYYLVYVQKEEGGEPVNDLRAVVSADTEIVSEKLEASGLKPEDLKVGDKVTVTTDGRMTFSIPPQASAQKIVIHDAETK